MSQINAQAFSAGLFRSWATSDETANNVSRNALPSADSAPQSSAEATRDILDISDDGWSASRGKEALPHDDRPLDVRIRSVLQDTGLWLGDGEWFELSVDRQGRIAVGGTMDAAKAAAFEEALNADATLGHDLLELLTYMKEKATGVSSDGPVESKLLTFVGEPFGVSPRWPSLAEPGLPVCSCALAATSDASEAKQYEIPVTPEPTGSKHTDPMAWMFGLSDPIRSLSNSKQLRTLSSIVQAGEEQLDAKVSGILRANGLSLADDETLEFKLDTKERHITVEGLADAEKAAAIEEALNRDETLANEILVQYARKNLCDVMFAKAGPVEDYIVSPLARVDTRLFGILVNEILQREAGASLADFSLSDDGSLVTENEKLAAMLSEEWGLRDGIKDILSDENQEPLEVSFAMKNGVLIDQEALSEEEIGYRVEEYKKGIKEIWRQYCVNPLTRVGPPSIDAFEITLGRFGQVRQIEAADGESLTEPDKELIETWFDGRWAKKISPLKAEMIREKNKDLSQEEIEELQQETKARGGDVLETQKEEARVNDARRDIVIRDILRRHEFEDGDTLQYEHEVRFHFDYRGKSSYTVLSEDADAAIQQQIGGVVGELSGVLQEYFHQEGVDMTKGLLVQFDEEGQLRCDLVDDDPRKGKVQAAVNKLNQALEQDQKSDSIGEPLAMLLDQVQGLLAGMHDPDTNGCAFAIGGQPGEQGSLQITLGKGLTVSIPFKTSG